MFEEWIWNAPMLARFAKHYQTGAPIPVSLVQRLRDAAEFGKGLDADRQAFLSRVALRLHTADPATAGGLARDLASDHSSPCQRRRQALRTSSSPRAMLLRWRGRFARQPWSGTGFEPDPHLSPTGVTHHQYRVLR